MPSNKTPAATYRAPGRFESTFVRSRLMDAVAAKLGIDRVEVRRRNLIPASEMPFTIAFNEPGVEELEVAGLSARGARVTLRYAEGVERLAEALAQQGLSLANAGGNWVLKAQ